MVAFLMDEVQQLLADISLRLSRLENDLGLRLQPATDDRWLKAEAAAKALEDQGVQSADELRDLVSWGVLTEPDCITNVARSPGRATWEFHIATCREQIRWWKRTLTPQQRQEFIARGRSGLRLAS